MASKQDGSTKRLAAKLLEVLPRLEKKRRSLYRNQFTELQCREWGNRTSSGAVLADAERTIGAAHLELKKHAVPGYPLFRLAWLCELTVELQGAIAGDALPEHRVVRREAEALAERARRLRTTAKNRLKGALEGNPAALKALSKEQPEKATPQQLPGLLGKLAARGRALRDDEDLKLLAEDAALTPDFLASLDELANELTEKVQETFKASGTNDSSLTNQLEGRVLRELAYLCDRVTNARKEGITVASVPLPRSVRSASRRK